MSSPTADPTQGAARGGTRMPQQTQQQQPSNWQTFKGASRPDFHRSPVIVLPAAAAFTQVMHASEQH